MCSVKTDPSPLIWNEETAEEKWSVSNKRSQLQEVVRYFVRVRASVDDADRGQGDGEEDAALEGVCMRQIPN